MKRSARNPIGLLTLLISLQFVGDDSPYVILYPVVCIPHLILDYQHKLTIFEYLIRLRNVINSKHNGGKVFVMVAIKITKNSICYTPNLNYL